MEKGNCFWVRRDNNLKKKSGGKDLKQKQENKSDLKGALSVREKDQKWRKRLLAELTLFSSVFNGIGKLSGVQVLNQEPNVAWLAAL